MSSRNLVSVHYPLFRVAVRYSDWKTSGEAPIAFVPSEASARSMYNTDINIKKTKDGFILYFCEDNADLLRGCGDNAPLTLYFKAYAMDSSLFYYADTAPLERGAIRCYSNKAPLEDCLIDDVVITNSEILRADTSPLHQVLNRNDRCRPPLFVVSFQIRLRPDFQIDKLPIGKTGCFVILLEPRQSYWKYFIPERFRIKQPAIRDVDNHVEFEQVLSSELPEACVFRSKTTLPLTAASRYRFQLMDGDAVFMKRLPVASPTQINAEHINGNKAWISEIYVNR